jgi:hypothetical protein
MEERSHNHEYEAGREILIKYEPLKSFHEEDE